MNKKELKIAALEAKLEMLELSIYYNHEAPPAGLVAEWLEGEKIHQRMSGVLEVVA